MSTSSSVSSVKKPVIAIIAAVSYDGVYGIQTDTGPTLPWMVNGKSEVPEDMRHFVGHTENHTVIMGYATFLSLNKKPLKNRRNIVITSKKMLQDGVAFARSFENAYTLACGENAERIYIIGGKSLIEHMLLEHFDSVDQMFITVIGKNYGPTNGVLLGTPADHKYTMFPMLLHPANYHPLEEVVFKPMISEASRIPLSFYAYKTLKVVSEV
jgi:dihydrofolate reductase